MEIIRFFASHENNYAQIKVQSTNRANFANNNFHCTRDDNKHAYIYF